MVSQESFGIMNKAYQVPKAVILEWLNDLLGVSLKPFLIFIKNSSVFKKWKSVQQRLFTVV